MEKKIETKNIVIVDDYALTRVILKKMLSLCTDFNVCAEFDNAEDSLVYIKNNHVDLVLMDLCLPYMNGVEASKFIKSMNPSIKIILLTSTNSDAEILSSLFGNVDAYVLKDITQDRLMKVIDRVLQGEMWIDYRVQLLVFNLIKSLPEHDYEYFKNMLNSTECTLINMILKGFEKKEVAQHLDIQLSDLANCVCSIFKKLAKTKKVEDTVRKFRYDFI